MSIRYLIDNFGASNKVYITSPDSEDGNPYFAMLMLAEKIKYPFARHIKIPDEMDLLHSVNLL